MHIPRATYRLQFNPQFGFQQASAILDYLVELGVSDIYASPVFKARPQSSHGYDIVNPLELNPELGSPADFRSLRESARQRGLFWLQDIVPNHMAFAKENSILMDLLENGVHSPYSAFFDIDWDHPSESLRGRLLAPFLGTFYAEALSAAEIQLSFQEQGISLSYHEHVFPLKIESYSFVFEKVLKKLNSDGQSAEASTAQFLGALELFKTSLQAGEAHSRSKQVEHAFAMIWGLYNQDDLIHQAVEETIALLNGKKGEPESFDSLDALISAQLFRLSFWKVAAEEINYRRFFTINELISLKVEEAAVFDFTHDLICRLIDEGVIDGVRVDHVDGLYDPAHYLGRLRMKAKDTFIVVEKILQYGEGLPADWPVQGTTGYDFMHQINSIFCDTRQEMGITRVYVKFTGSMLSYSALVSEKKRLIIGKHLAGNIDNLAQKLKRICGSDRYGRDITLYGLRRALVEVMAWFPVYRTYITSRGLCDQDVFFIQEAVNRARESTPGLTYELDFIEKYLLLHYPEGLTETEFNEWVGFVMAFQQYTAPLMAKGFEDTILYCYNRLLSLNEVGGNPSLFGISIDDFHAFQVKRMAGGDRSLNASSTHDCKRQEDVRARINVLSEIPEEWEAFLKTAARLNRQKKQKIDQIMMPDANDEYFIYQTLLGIFPFEEKEISSCTERREAYIVKAVREAKVHTAWIRPDSEYEQACISFVRALLDQEQENAFLPEFLRFQKKVAFYGVFNSLSQLTVKVCSPGIPDFYQGSELWDLALVDPDNRRSVDFSRRAALLEQISGRDAEGDRAFLKELLENPADGRVKLYFTQRLLRARRDSPLLFQEGSYIPLEVKGSRRDNLIAFARQDQGCWALCVAGRFFTRLIEQGGLPVGEQVWQDTEIVLPPGAPGSWYDLLGARSYESGRTLRACDLFSVFPSALLIATNKEQ